MLTLAIVLKAALIAGILAGAGLALARLTLPDSSGQPLSESLRAQRVGFILAGFAGAAAFALLIYRLTGSLDPAIAAMVATSPPGIAAGLVLLGAAIGISHRRLAVLGAVSIIAATAVAGHAAAQSLVAGAIVGAHVAAAAWWTGGLLLLLGASRGAAPRFLVVLDRFSRQAVWAILLLLAAGAWVVVELVGLSLSALNTGYGWTIVAKVLVAGGALSIAMYNRARLTPAVREGTPGAMRRLRNNISAELALIAVVVVATGVLTTTMSPPGSGH